MKQLFWRSADTRSVKRFYLPFLFLPMLVFASPLFAEPNIDNTLAVTVARQTLHQVLSEIAQDIGEIQNRFPQLKKWDAAQISPSQIRYQRDNCNLLIYTSDSPEFSGNATLLKVGVYLKLTASGDRAEEFKQAVQAIIAHRFEKIHNLRLPAAMQ